MSEPVPQSNAAFPHRHVPIDRPGAPRQAIALELAAPLALGQRGLVIAPPRCGATSVLRWLGGALLDGVPGLELHVVLVDRPVEESLEWSLELPDAHIVGTTSEAGDAESHVALTSVFRDAAERAASGAHVALLVDSLAALARALAATTDASDGRVLDGGIPQAALRELRGLFGLARTGPPGDESAGTLTILATVSVDTAQQLDEVVVQELIGTGNVEWRLSRELMDAGLFPPVDVTASGARRTEYILTEDEADRRALLRSHLDDLGPIAGLGTLQAQLDEHLSLEAVVDTIAGVPESRRETRPPIADDDAWTIDDLL